MINKKTYTSVLIYLIIFSSALSAWAVNSTLNFPLPKQLEPNVEFWVRIFGIYSENQVVIHDSYNPGIVYEIINLNDYYPHNVSIRIKWKKINRIIKDYQNILLKLHGMKSIKLAELSDKERSVYLAWIEDDNPNKFKKAAYAVRGQRGLKEDFKNGLVRSGRYLPEFQEIFKKHNVPIELLYLPHIESSFTNRAYSKVGAAGLWQFIRSTGRLYLDINRYVDERLDPFAASDAAARLLKHNYQILDSWPLAITAYNHGTNGMIRAKRSLRTNDFGIIVEKYKSRTFGFASRNFYAEFLAAVEVRKNHQKYFGPLVFDKPDAYTLFQVPESQSLNNICQKLNVTNSQIINLNPGLQSRVIKSALNLPRNFKLRIPVMQNIDPYLLYAGVYEQYNTNLSNWLPDTDFDSFIDHLYATSNASTQVRFTQRLQPVTIEYVSAFNRLSDEGPEDFLFTDLVQYHSNTASDNILKNNVNKKKTKKILVENDHSDAKLVLSKELIAQVDSFNIYLSMEPQGPLAPRVVMQAKIEEQVSDLMNKMNFDIDKSQLITVLPNETLGHYADWLNLPTQTLRSLNRLGYRRDIQIGQKIRIKFNRESRDKFLNKRLHYHMELRKNFYTDYSVVGTKSYKIQNGDNIWYLCKSKFNVPFWLVANYNLGILLNSLKPGDEIQIPIISPFAQNRSFEYQG